MILVPDLKVICAWCSTKDHETVIREGVEPVSHGICRACAAGVRATLLPPAPQAPERSDA